MGNCGSQARVVSAFIWKTLLSLFFVSPEVFFIFLECCFLLPQVMLCLLVFKDRTVFGVAVAKHKEPTFRNILRPQLNYAWKHRRVLIWTRVPRGSCKQKCCLQPLAMLFWQDNSKIFVVWIPLLNR